MSNITIFRPPKKPADATLESNIGEFESILLIGYDHDGELRFASSANLDGANVLWLIESFKANLLRGDYHR